MNKTFIFLVTIFIAIILIIISAITLSGIYKFASHISNCLMKIILFNTKNLLCPFYGHFKYSKTRNLSLESLK